MHPMYSKILIKLSLTLKKSIGGNLYLMAYSIDSMIASFKMSKLYLWQNNPVEQHGI